MRRKRIVLVSSLVLCLSIGYAFARYTAGAGLFSKYFGVSALTFIKSPLAYWRVEQRDWNSFNALRYTQDHGGARYRRNVETILLPLVIDGSRLSDSYPAPKMGGAITVVGTTVIILDRLGGLYRYDLTTGSFGLLPGIPRLPNNLDAYLVQRPGPPVNLADAPNDEFRARDIIFLSDRKELAVAYDKFDETLGKLQTVVSVIPFDVMTLRAAGAWKQIFASDAFLFGGITSGAGRLAYREDEKLFLTVGDHYIFDPKVSEDPNTTFGKTIEIDLTTNTWRQFTKGHRNHRGVYALAVTVLPATSGNYLRRPIRDATIRSVVPRCPWPLWSSLAKPLSKSRDRGGLFRTFDLLSTGGELSARMGFQISLGGGDCGSGISRRRDRCWSFRVGGRGAWAAVGL
jgi:hypothetical protein